MADHVTEHFQALKICGHRSILAFSISVQHFDACIFQEERNKATFTLDRKIIAEKIRTALNEKKEQLQESVTYKNGMTKKNPWKNIENFNNYYCKKYDFNIIE